jgi:hypothetical protein
MGEFIINENVVYLKFFQSTSIYHLELGILEFIIRYSRNY